MCETKVLEVVCFPRQLVLLQKSVFDLIEKLEALLRVYMFFLNFTLVFLLVSDTSDFISSDL